jgi:hypothetical protein
MWVDGRRFWGVFALAFGLIAGVTAEQNPPHQHSGLLQPYRGAPPRIVLTRADRELLAQGKAVYKSLDYADGVRVAAVFRVAAEPALIWSLLKDFESYPEWIDDVLETEVYRRVDDQIFVRFRVKYGPGELSYFAYHRYPGERLGWGTWTLDYSRKSDLNDTVGYWRVDPAPDAPGSSYVTYSATVRWSDWLATLFSDVIARRGLRVATEWVKIQAEKPAR